MSPRTPQIRVVPAASWKSRAAQIARDQGERLSRQAAQAMLGARATLLKRRVARRWDRLPRPLRLCLGSGSAPLAGWENVDLDPAADAVLDLRFGLPLPDASVELIYSEHFIEHLHFEDCLNLMREWRRVLAPGGRVRVATPDLELLVSDYKATWRRHDWLTWPEYSWVDTPVRMVNHAFRAWGHLYLYDFDELAERLRSAGFETVERCELGQSNHPALSGLETRKDSTLIAEAAG